MTYSRHATLVVLAVILVSASTGLLVPTVGGTTDAVPLTGEANDNGDRTVEGETGPGAVGGADSSQTYRRTTRVVIETDAIIQTAERPPQTGDDGWEIERDGDDVDLEGPAVEYENDQHGIEIELEDASVTIDIDDDLEIDGPDYEIDHEGSSLDVEGAAIDYESDCGVADVEAGGWEIEQSGRLADVEGEAVSYERDADSVEIDVLTAPVEIEIDADGADIDGPGYEIDHDGDSLDVETDDEPAPSAVVADPPGTVAAYYI